MIRFFFLALMMFFPLKAQTKYDTSGLYDYSLGNPKAPIKFSIFFAFTCVHCKRWHDEVWPELKKNYVDKGLVYATFIDVPIDQISYTTSIIGHCKKGIAFEGLKDVLFDKQEDYMGLSIEDDEARQKHALDFVKKQVLLAGLKNNDIEQCLTHEPLKGAVLNRLKEARDRYGFQSTPGFKINDTIFPQYMKYDDLKKAFEGILHPEQKKEGFFSSVMKKLSLPF